jgi:iron complex transport system substrate-binding protein
VCPGPRSVPATWSLHVSASRPFLTAPRPVRSLLVLTASLAFLGVACGGAASARPSNPPDATGSLLAPATAVASPSPSAVAAFPMTLTDDDGTTLELAAAPQKIVSLTPATTEILFRLGAGSRVIGKVEDIANFPPEAADVPVVGTFSGVDVEKIVGLGSDLVIAGGNGGTPPQAIEQLRDLEIPVLVVYASDVEGALHDITLTGESVGEADAAADLVASMRAGFDQVRTATATVPKPRVFYETGDQPSIYGIAEDSVYEEMIGLAGGTPVTTGSATSWEMSVEKLVAADPELIILGDSAYGVTPEAVAKRPGWAGISAVKDGAITGIDDIVVTRPGPRLVDGLKLLVGAIHPELGLGPSPVASPLASPAASAG